jgi:hypothetical protein
VEAVIVAVVRPDGWDLPLFLHVLGAIALTGATAAAAVLALAAVRQTDTGRAALLGRLTFRTLLLAALPAFVLMRAAAEWINSKEDVPGDPTWLGLGYVVSDAGFVLLVLLTIVTGIATRGGRAGAWPTRVVTVVAPLYLAALAVAVWAMTAKPA